MLSSPLNGFRYSLAGRNVDVHKNTLTNNIHSQTRTHENNIRGYRQRLKIIQIETENPLPQNYASLHPRRHAYTQNTSIRIFLCYIPIAS